MRILDMTKLYAVEELVEEEDLDAGNTGWQYGRSLSRATGFIPQRQIAGFPKTAGGMSKTPSVGMPRVSKAPVGKGTAVGRLASPMGRSAGMGKRSILEADGVSIDPVVGFHPPSLALRNKETRIPADNPGEKDDRFLDKTKRNSKDTWDTRMKMLKTHAPAGLPPQIPARTTLVEQHSAMYGKAGRMRRTTRGMFTSYVRRGIL